MIILSVETSCDETSVAITKDGKEVLSNIVLSQIDIHQKFGGVVPEIASRNHVVSISRIFDEAIKAANITVSQIDLVAVTKGPGLVGSLLVGMVAATTFAYANDLPLLGVNHLYGHIYAAQIEHEIIFPALCLLVSGGHTELIYLKGHHDITILGQTLDDAVGEAYDKVARLLNIPYPGGPIVDRLASLGTPSYQLPRPYLRNEPYNFSFSGLKSAVANLINKLKQNDQEINVNDMCASFQESVTDVLVTKTKQAAADFNVKQIILAGGVAANNGLRKKMNNMITDIPVIAPSIKYCTDQAAMIGIAAYYQLKKDNLCKEYNLKVVPTLNL